MKAPTFDIARLYILTHSLTHTYIHTLWWLALDTHTDRETAKHTKNITSQTPGLYIRDTHTEIE